MYEETKQILENYEKRIQALEKQLINGPSVTKKNLSIKEFLLSKKTEGDVQKGLVIGYYLEKYSGFGSFNAKDIDKGFRDAKEKAPVNVNETLDKNVRKGHMMVAKEKKDKLKAWTLTNTGEGFVENDIKKEK